MRLVFPDKLYHFDCFTYWRIIVLISGFCSDCFNLEKSGLVIHNRDDEGCYHYSYWSWLFHPMQGSDNCDQSFDGNTHGCKYRAHPCDVCEAKSRTTKSILICHLLTMLMILSETDSMRLIFYMYLRDSNNLRPHKYSECIKNGRKSKQKNASYQK